MLSAALCFACSGADPSQVPEGTLAEDTWNFLRSAGQILDVTDPLQPVIVNEDAFFAFSINVAWHDASKRWC